ncbi:CocE/NonD family hydrolase [Crocinitomicaceae bacterium]|nr:CocE/NonD family hydrolase [Crocinitomicaceae bacterium]
MKPIVLCAVFCAILFLPFAQTRTSHFIKMPDGVKLAADVYFLENYTDEKLPVLVQFERYWRSSIDKKTGDTSFITGRDLYFNENGYIIMIVNTRGTGASFGVRQSEYSPVQVKDSKSVLDWIVDQPWCDGSIGSYGTSYTGTTAELLCATQHPALKAVIPGWSDFDLYRSPARPYGMLASKFINRWGRYVNFLDKNRSMILRSSVNPVDEDSLKFALKEHKDNPKVHKYTRASDFRDHSLNGFDYDECSVIHWQKEIEASGVPMFVIASWMDAGTAEGTLQRLEHFSNPQKVLLMSTAHGGWCNADPFVVDDLLFYPDPITTEQSKRMLDFLDFHLKGRKNGVDEWPLIQYYNIGDPGYKESNAWPISGTSEKKLYLGASDGLLESVPELDGRRSYDVDFGVHTSTYNRWTTQMEGPVKGLNNRNAMDDRMLVYTSVPMEDDLQITGAPEISLWLSSTHEDGVVLVYLEDVDENGKSVYVTEGGLRLIHRKMAEPSDSTFNLHTFNEKDAALMIPGKVEEITLRFLPTSVTIKKGHSIRIAIAGADKGIFDKCPKRGKPTLDIHASEVYDSHIVLPVVSDEK